jgi:hypothetical protein
MTFGAFIILCIIVCALASLGSWLIRKFMPDRPPAVDYIIWGVALAIIIVTLFSATGLMRYDPKIPHLP